MEYFTLKECEELIKHYTPLIVGRNAFNDVKIEKLIIENYENNNNMIYCIGKRKHPLNYKKSIISVATSLNLDPPSEFIKTLHQ